MAEMSQSELKAAVSAIMEGKQAQLPVSQLLERADLSALRRSHHERLQSEFAKAGLDFSRLEKLYDEYKEEADKLLKSRTPSIAGKSVQQTKNDKEWIQNKREVYELLSGRPLITFPLAIEAPISIYSVPSSSLIDSHIESWNSWAKWHHFDNKHTGTWSPEHQYSKRATIMFLFNWYNNSPNAVVIKSANADLFIRGLCQAFASPYIFDWSETNVYFFTSQRVFVGASILSTDYYELIRAFAWTHPFIAGGVGDFDAYEFETISHVRCQDIIVPGYQSAFFEVGAIGAYTVENGWADYYFGDSGSQSGERIACPALNLELSLVIHP